MQEAQQIPMLTADQALEQWAQYTQAGRLLSAGHVRGGGRAGYDHALYVCLHVEGFWMERCSGYAPRLQVLGRTEIIDDPARPGRKLRVGFQLVRTAGLPGDRQVVLHVLSGGRLDAFVWRWPGETKLKALIRLGWGRFLTTPNADIAQDAFDEAYDAFQEWYENHPCPVRLAASDADTGVVTSSEREQLERAQRSRTLTTGQAAKMMGFKDHRAVTNLITRGQLPGYSGKGDRYFTTLGDVLDFLAGRRRAG